MGFILGLMSAVFAASKDLLSKRLAFRIDGTASTFASFFFALPFYVIVLTILGLSGAETTTWTRSFLLLVFLRAVTDTAAEWLKMYALAYGDISIVATFFSLSPLFLLVTSPLITGDPLSWFEVAAVSLVVAGSIVMVYRPSLVGWQHQMKGILLASGAALFFSLNSCFDRLAVKEGTPVFTGFTMTLLSAVFLVPFVIGHPQRMEGLRTNWLGLTARGVLEIAFMVCKLAALQYLTAPDVVALQRLSLVLSIIGGRVFFKEADFVRRLLAGLLILGGAFVVGWVQRETLAQLLGW
ncbi:MAG: DMT family transporter [Gemmatales bacterium]|nr:DMT family transporter [Gemmatales bacterium]MDW8387496.1 DMT family transporter [Gemmatales bacterium]